VRAQAADERRLLIAVLALAPPLIVVLPIATLLEVECHPHCWHRSGGHFVCILTRCGRSRHTNPLLILNELVCERSKELEAACLLVVCMDYCFIEKEGTQTIPKIPKLNLRSQRLVARLRSNRNLLARILLCMTIVPAPS
jgi:hypothetical protein